MSVFNALRSQLLRLLNDTAYESRTPKVLLVADENITLEDISSPPKNIELTILTNRKDLALDCEEKHLHAVFNDFDFNSVTQHSSFDIFVYRISKERPLVHHILNEIYKRSTDSTQLLLCGKKNEGIKNYHQKLIKHKLFNGKLAKDGDIYSGVLSIALNTADESSPLLLDNKNYSSTREITSKNNDFRFQSKPGLYGWNKVDDGSRLLIEQLAVYVNENEDCTNFRSALDLGCGFGYLSLKLLELLKAKDKAFANLSKLTATDNNAAAIRCCQANLRENSKTLVPDNGLELNVIADDCGKHIKEKFDLILCNPPFHQGFDQKRDLSERFCSAISRLITKDGMAFVVVNAFIPFEKLASAQSLKSVMLVNNNQFKILLLTKL